MLRTSEIPRTSKENIEMLKQKYVEGSMFGVSGLKVSSLASIKGEHINFGVASSVISPVARV
jgi:hypothetical protein